MFMNLKDLENMTIFDQLHYEYTYPIEAWVMQEFHRRPDHSVNYFDYIEEFVEQQLKAGQRRHKEEKEWSYLLYVLNENLNWFNQGVAFPPYIFYILLDQALILEHEGNNIPNLLR